MNVVSVLDRWASATPEQSAIVASRGRRDAHITYGELRNASSRLAGKLKRRGVRPGDRVSVLVGLSINAYIAMIGVLWAGAAPVIVDPGGGVARARACFRKAKPKAMVVSRRTLLLARLLPELRHLPAVHVQDRGSLAEIEDRAHNAEALLTFTSGSTGTPSAVARSHNLLIAQNAALQDVLQHKPGDRWLATLPIFVLAHLAEGATAILADADLRRPARIDGKRLARQAERCRVNAVVAAPSLLQRLAEARSNSNPVLRVFTGGAPVFPSTVEQLRSLSARGDITVVYGSTEAEPIAHLVCEPGCSWDPTLQGVGLPVGRPCSAVSLRLVRTPCDASSHSLSEHEFTERCVPEGEPGEIVVTGEHVVKGYVDGVGDEMTKLRVGSGTTQTIWHRTGDAARVDTSGRLWLLGRWSERVPISIGGFRYPFEVEAPLREQFGVECALVQHRGVPILAVAPQRGPIESRLTAELERLADEGITAVSVPRIPLDKRHNGKTDYAALARLLEKAPGR